MLSLQENASRCPLKELDENPDDGDVEMSDGEDDNFSSPVPEASPAPVKEVPPAPVEEVPRQKVPTSPEPTKKSPPISDTEVNYLIYISLTPDHARI